ncbi:imidazolonepropionase [Mucilaginibacter sp. BT774]|uniref:imidazolonepropionase n=1 Tax=Mucilaginibacter sp. BT774 TaxID=3062276 RepID=UPI002676AE04|nr:imidazolonepropionase [Mucilaginibacter sp. BT774]MDO3628700.1 imidazolonepropionase [Mucilaginibacter sp. BT774]
MKKLIGPFTQILPLSGLPVKEPIADDALQIIPQGGILTENGLIAEVGDFGTLRKSNPQAEIEEIQGDHILLPGFIDCHTHLCFAGSRAKDYALRIAGKSYLEIARSGGGIWDSVTQTRAASKYLLAGFLVDRVKRHLRNGVTTIEVKTGYGLSIEQELKQLEAIKIAADNVRADLIPTCLATHILPKDFNGPVEEYLELILNKLLPKIKQENLANRVDIFIEDGAFSTADAACYLEVAKKMGFDITVHADQFSTGGSEVAVTVGAVSADHLEASGEQEIKRLAASETVAVALPGASLGLGMGFAPARKLLNAGACLAIASDWNPGSAPMGDLLLQASVLSAYEKLTTAETFAALTFRAAKALNLYDRGVLETGKLADMQAYPCADYREILYHQGRLKPDKVWKASEQLI